MQDSLSHPHTQTHTQTERSAKTAQRLQCWRRLRLRRSNIDSAAEQRAEWEWVCVRGRERDSRRDDVERSTVFSWLCFSFAICVCVCFPSARDEALRVCAWKCARCLAREILFSMTCCTRAPWQFYSSLSARICNNVPRKTLKERKTYVSQCSAKLKIEVQKKYKNKNTKTTLYKKYHNILDINCKNSLGFFINFSGLVSCARVCVRCV